MNKYLTAFNETTKKLAKELNESEWAVLSKLQISAEIDNMLGWDDFEKVELTDTQAETLTNIIYDIYMQGENDLGLFEPTKAVMRTLLDDYHGLFDWFMEDYNENYSKLYDSICWRLDY